MKPTTKHERNAAKALARSKRNSPRPKPKEKRQRRLPHQWNEHSTVPNLREACAKRGIKTTTKMRKAELIDLLVKS